MMDKKGGWEMDVSKLTPAPWEAEEFDSDYGSGALYAKPHGRFIGVMGENYTDAEFIALARNAFDVMMRRGWRVGKKPGCVDAFVVESWQQVEGKILWSPVWPGHVSSDPFTALVEADKWYKENVEITPSQTPPREQSPRGS